MSEVFQPGFGARLKAGRESKNLAVADVAAKLKLTSRQVEALESEDLSHLPSEVFVRGFVRNYARLVEVDADSLITPVDIQAAVAETITAPSAGVAFSHSGLRRWVVLPVAALVVFLVLVALLYHWLRQGEDSLVAPEAATTAQTQAEVAPPQAEPAPVESQMLQLSPQASVMADGEPAPGAPSAEPQAPANAAAQAVPPVPAQSTVPAKPPISATVPTPLPSPTAPTPANVMEKPVAVKPAGAHTLRFEPGQDAWIQVVDGNGNRFSKLVRAGSMESFTGEPPFRLVVGEAARVRMSYDGHVIDLAPFIGQKVARLTLE